MTRTEIDRCQSAPRWLSSGLLDWNTDHIRWPLCRSAIQHVLRLVSNDSTTAAGSASQTLISADNRCRHHDRKCFPTSGTCWSSRAICDCRAIGNKNECMESKTRPNRGKWSRGLIHVLNLHGQTPSKMVQKSPPRFFYSCPYRRRHVDFQHYV